MLKEWRKGDQLILEANPNYWGEKATTDTLVFRWSPEAAQRLLELQSGNVNGIDNPGPDDFEVIEEDATLTLYPRAGTNVFYVGMNNAFAPFDNEKVRQAFAMAIDRNRIVDNFYPAGSIVATQFMPPSIFGYSEGLDWYDYNPEMAKQILTEEGVYDADGVFKTKISYRDVVRGYLPEPGVVAQDIQAQLEEIGVEAEINVMESGTFLDAADDGRSKACICWAGAPTIRTPPTSSITTLAPARASSSARSSRTSSMRSSVRPPWPTRPSVSRSTTRPTS